jgi:hypothetical protein
MVKPDWEMVHEETGHIYHGGKVYDVTRMTTGWVLTRPCQLDVLYTGVSVEECCDWVASIHHAQHN